MTQIHQNNHHSGKKKIAILIEQEVEDVEFTVPYNGLKQAGMEVVVIGSRMNEKYKGKRGKLSVQAEATTAEAVAEEFAAVVIPGGMAPDKMRRNCNTVCFVRDAMNQGKLVAAICHGSQVLIEGDLLKGKQATGFTAIRKDISNAGATYLDEPLVMDGNLITSREPGDLAIFTTAILNRLGYGGKDVELPDVKDTSAEWWKLADAWGGSTKNEIIKGLNTALAGERYSLEALENYVKKESDQEIKALFQEIKTNKQRHTEKLEIYLQRLHEKPSLAANVANQYAKVKTALTGSDDIYQLRCALGDIQTGIGDMSNLSAMYTDPVATAIFKEIQNDLGKYEQRLIGLYQARLASGIKPPKPTTGAAVTM
ncbi:DJ-1/PfpI/YhbO family deglycase/protease [Anabaena cylindrica FACHB-243]|uniref:Intracellular protease, PfpI family n=1 Tax=Anabaena cylindrica (strain ATCC 27899 / PCC 7122) TaxID=272123 RepID=K9ZC86_ANACC|nr:MULTISPECIES: DJ-1/PfpI/YhbO family deglycase/protease [Anabaena]AFZ56339.1 intracellular protease, PfpI family [Anabaena cylindrica PCC 7122]MBD2418212.1 DJ-1/PfpI/YhbO family deglycase/protease [Anabaena cylindrica FACHB-243]MBY5283939.1 DJ-1/PfpI/YhbO family deglycase/protease [Anabaena sp. CCAP 1446/1C]MBY5308039.1 DJ-1/PfpI/YhbO family deglycase/protease [Anabaena sp. CCAP 1446/1C]MCM2409066.1 DJ-1/PfpI/YhbO family deglycase/protease [Anabaena sp. CCAP 1446/1C]